MNQTDYYTRKQVADLLGIAKVTVYHYAKQNKIRKVPDPHHAMREARYYKEEVDALVEQRKAEKVEGYSTSEVSKELGISQQKIYQLIEDNELMVHKVPYGDERIRYVIPEETLLWIKEQIERTAPTRGVRSEFYDSALDITLYQLFTSTLRGETRVVRNADREWGFYSSSHTWIPYTVAIKQFKFTPVYAIHRPSLKASGYTDFILPKDNELSYVFLDFMYRKRGIENIRLREHEEHIALSIKSGPLQVKDSVPAAQTVTAIQSFLEGGAGDVLFEEDEWIFVSGYRKTSVDLPVSMLDTLHKLAKQEQTTTNELVEQALQEFIQRRYNY